jgi:hypothetical protein
MRYTHRDDPGREASVTTEPPTGGKYPAVVRWSEAGKSRRKTIKKASAYEARSAAARFLLEQGFILRAPQTGALQWMTAIHEPFPHGFPLAIDPSNGAIWIGGTGAILSVEPGTCAMRAVPVGEGVMVRSVGCSADGTVVAVLDVEGGTGPIGDSPWRAPGRGPFSYGIVRVHGGELVAIAQVPHEAGSAIAANLSASRDGDFMGPHVDGAALYNGDGRVVRTFSAARTEHTAPVVALSPSGRWGALTAEAGVIRLVDLVDDSEQMMTGSFSQVHSIRVDDDGGVLVGGFVYPSWGVYRVTASAEPVRLFESMGGALTPDGDAVIAVAGDHVTRSELIPAADEWPKVLADAVLPALCGGRASSVYFVDATHVIVATRSHTLAGIDLSRLTAPEHD